MGCCRRRRCCRNRCMACPPPCPPPRPCPPPCRCGPPPPMCCPPPPPPPMCCPPHFMARPHMGHCCPPPCGPICMPMHCAPQSSCCSSSCHCSSSLTTAIQLLHTLRLGPTTTTTTQCCHSTAASSPLTQMSTPNHMLQNLNLNIAHPHSPAAQFLPQQMQPPVAPQLSILPIIQPCSQACSQPSFFNRPQPMFSNPSFDFSGLCFSPFKGNLGFENGFNFNNRGLFDFGFDCFPQSNPFLNCSNLF